MISLLVDFRLIIWGKSRQSSHETRGMVGNCMPSWCTLIFRRTSAFPVWPNSTENEVSAKMAPRLKRSSKLVAPIRTKDFLHVLICHEKWRKNLSWWAELVFPGPLGTYIARDWSRAVRKKGNVSLNCILIKHLSTDYLTRSSSLCTIFSSTHATDFQNRSKFIGILTYVPFTKSKRIEFFKYNGGRWLYNEEEREWFSLLSWTWSALETASRYVEFNVAEIQHVACTAVGAQRCVTFRNLGEGTTTRFMYLFYPTCSIGSYNKVFSLIFVNGMEAIARLPTTLAGAPFFTTASEIDSGVRARSARYRGTARVYMEN